jgi:hypothetical protein
VESLEALLQWWRSEDTSSTSLASTGVVAGAVVVSVSATFVWKHPGHRVDGIATIIQLVGALLTVPIVVRKLLAPRPRLTASMLAGECSGTAFEPRWIERGAFRLAAGDLVRTALRRWRVALVLGLLLFGVGVAVGFLVGTSLFTKIVLIVLLSLGLLFGLFGLCAMALPRRLHAPLSSETEILSPLQLAGDERVQGALGIAGLVLVLGSIMLKFVALYA